MTEAEVKKYEVAGWSQEVGEGLNLSFRKYKSKWGVLSGADHHCLTL